MIRPAAVICALALVASCSRGGDPEPAAAASAAAPVARSSVAGPTGNMSATVSALSGAKSDLNVRVTDFGVVVDLPADALFDFDKATLTANAEVELRKAAELIRRSPPGPIGVVGHTDSRGDDAYNQALSEARAKTVAAWFGQQVGVRQRAFQVSGKGETAPIAANETANGADDPQGRARNRRVEVILPKP